MRLTLVALALSTASPGCSANCDLVYRSSALAVTSAEGFERGVRACFDDLCSEPATQGSVAIFIILGDDDDKGTLRLEDRDKVTLSELDLKLHVEDNPCFRTVSGEATYTSEAGLVEVTK